jgi:hypothetical protein
VNETHSVESDSYIANLDAYNSGMEAQVAVDETAFSSSNPQAYESLKKIKKSRMEHNRLKEATEQAF